jgi:hypothetical protein
MYYLRVIVVTRPPHVNRGSSLLMHNRERRSIMATTSRLIIHFVNELFRNIKHYIQKSGLKIK